MECTGSEPLDDDHGDHDTLVCEARFVIVPEWVNDADISDCAYRLYSVLLRYGQTSGNGCPAGRCSSALLHKTSKDTVDRASKELVAIGAVRDHRRTDVQTLTNRYHPDDHPAQRPTAGDP